jgi:hypothetical protein
MRRLAVPHSILLHTHIDLIAAPASLICPKAHHLPQSSPPCRVHRTQGPWELIQPLGCGLHPATTLIKTEAAVALAPRKETHTRLRNFYTTGSEDTVLGNRSDDTVLGNTKGA